MTERPDFSLALSEYNDFLFAAVGQEETGMPLTVQTAFLRLGLDPWLEAARLSGLSKAAAVQALTAAMARLPEGDWNASTLPAIATRLVGILPGRTAPAMAATVARRFNLPTLPFVVPKALLWIVLAAALLGGLLFLQGGGIFQSASPLDSVSSPYNK